MINKSEKGLPDQYLCLEWKNLSLIHNKTGKTVLEDLNGMYQSGDFVTIMGPSGAGKSSLLSTITARIKSDLRQFSIQGYTEMNGSPYTLDQFSKSAAYVPQDDLLFGTLTVKETFMLQAKLKLWQHSEEQLEKDCFRIMKAMNLLDCQDSLIGNGQFKKCISGGQKKRVAIGVELLSDPRILVFDEPTSGLDSHNALAIINLLKKLAVEEQKLIITTIHQPSSLIFKSLDILYLMKEGRCIYNGSASRIIEYMEKIGITINYRMNPADFFMLEMSSIKQKDGYKTPLTVQHFNQFSHHYIKQHYPKSSHAIQQNSTTFTQKTNKQIEKSTPFFRQFAPLINRSYLTFIRTPSNQMNKLVAAFLIPIVLGLMYLGAADGAPPDIAADPLAFTKFALEFPAFIFMSSYFVFAMNTYDTILVFPAEKELILKQASSGLYSIMSYYLARLLAQFWGCVIPGLISGVLLYIMVNMELTIGHFAFFVGMFVFLAFEGYIFGIFFGVVCKDTRMAIDILPLFFIAFMIVGGLSCNLNDIPLYIRWMQYISPMRHGYFFLLLDQLKTQKMQGYINNEIVLRRFGIHGDIYQPIYWELGLFGFYLVGSIVMLYWMKRRM